MDSEKNKFFTFFRNRQYKKIVLLVLFASGMYTIYINYKYPIIFTRGNNPSEITEILESIKKYPTLYARENNLSEITSTFESMKENTFPNISLSTTLPALPSYVPKSIKTRVVFPDEPKNASMEFPKITYKEASVNASEVKHLKKIIYWNDSYGQKHFGLGYGQLPFIMAGCQFNNCFATGKRDLFKPHEWDALLWHFRSNDRSLPTERVSKTKYIFFMAESAYYLFGNLQEYDNKFNLTHTYRIDSDIPARYGIVVKRKTVDKTFLDSHFNPFKTKTKKAAWFVSNCAVEASARSKLTATLKKYIAVDIYGECGELKCPRTDSHKCYKMLEKDYYFYLSFENSLCKDYVTEKFFNILNYNVIPVVYGYGPYWKHAPPHSYIDVFDFPSVKHLSEYMVYLTKNATAYNEYFRWKAYYTQLNNSPKRATYLCRMCELLNKNETKVYKYLKNWFVDKPPCKTGDDTEVSKFINGFNFKIPFNKYTNHNMDELKNWVTI